MGRLTLNMLLSFAQFEREIAGERIRDKIAASKAKGMCMGGTVPLGYRVQERKLVVIPAEAETVRLIFRRYAELGSVALLRTELDRRNIRSKRREGAGGRLAGGQKFSRGALYLLLQNRLYRGEVAHKDKVYPGQHDAIVDAELWQMVQDKLASKRRERSLAGGAEARSLLSGLIFDSAGNRMSPTHAVKKGKRYRYYVSAPLITGSRTEHLNGRRIPAGDVEGLVLDRMRALFASEKEVGEAIAPLSLEAPIQRAVLDRSAKLAKRWTALASLELRALVKSLVQQVRVGDAEISVWLNRIAVVSSVMSDATPRQRVQDRRRTGRPVDRRYTSPGRKGDSARDRRWHREQDRRRSCIPDRPSDRYTQHAPFWPRRQHRGHGASARSEARLSDSPRSSLLSLARNRARHPDGPAARRVISDTAHAPCEGPAA